MDAIGEVQQLLDGLKGKKILNIQTDGSTITLLVEGGVTLVIGRGYYEKGVPDNSYLTVNDLGLF